MATKTCTSAEDQYQADLDAARAARTERQRLAALEPGSIIGGDDRYQYISPGHLTAASEERLRRKGYTPAPDGDSAVKVGLHGVQLWRKPKVVATEDWSARRERMAARLAEAGASDGRPRPTY